MLWNKHFNVEALRPCAFASFSLSMTQRRNVAKRSTTYSTLHWVLVAADSVFATSKSFDSSRVYMVCWSAMMDFL